MSTTRRNDPVGESLGSGRVGSRADASCSRRWALNWLEMSGIDLGQQRFKATVMGLWEDDFKGGRFWMSFLALLLGFFQHFFLEFMKGTKWNIDFCLKTTQLTNSEVDCTERFSFVTDLATLNTRQNRILVNFLPITNIMNFEYKCYLKQTMRTTLVNRGWAWLLRMIP